MAKPETKNCSRIYFFWHRNFAKKNLRFDPTLGSNNLGLKNSRIKNHHIFGIARTSAFIWHIWIPLKKFCKRTRRVCVCIVLVHFGRYSQEVNEKSVKLAVWAVSSNFLHDFTLFVVDIHQIRLISLFWHFPDHFHFHGSAGLIPKINLSLRHINSAVTIAIRTVLCIKATLRIYVKRVKRKRRRISLKRISRWSRFHPRALTASTTGLSRFIIGIVDFIHIIHHLHVFW